MIQFIRLHEKQAQLVVGLYSPVNMIGAYTYGVFFVFVFKQAGVGDAHSYGISALLYTSVVILVRK